jgi:hypothetical protein
VAGRGAAVTRWIVDASNVIGAKPDGWWRDRDGAAARLIEVLRAWDEEALVVLDAGPPDWAGPDVVIAPRPGRNAADDEIVRLVEADEDPSSLRVVTSDADLAARVRALGAAVEGAGAFRRRLGI